MAEGEVTTTQQLRDGFAKLGLAEGDCVLVHSAMRTIGTVEGGAQSVVAAILDLIGPTGTLCAPTFCFYNEAVDERGEVPLIDNSADKTEMGSIAETTRLWPGALRSTAFRHSVAAVGRRAKQITEVDPRLCCFDMRSVFGQMLCYNTKIVLLGLNYTNCTACHFGEFTIEAPYRTTLRKVVNVKQQDGSVVEGVEMTDYQPKPSADGSYYGDRGPDFNRIGQDLERKGLVAMNAIGNAACRCFKMRDLIDEVVEQAKADPFCLKIREGQPTGYSTVLEFGTVVLSPEFLDGAGRADIIQWMVMDPAKLKMHKPFNGDFATFAKIRPATL
eukprot:SAG31_NODE_4269_length_3392_cov_1.946250_1_plen_330_part_00